MLYLKSPKRPRTLVILILLYLCTGLAGHQISFEGLGLRQNSRGWAIAKGSVLTHTDPFAIAQPRGFDAALTPQNLCGGLLAAWEPMQKYRLAICAVFQNESFFLREWLEFHKLLGVEHFYLYNNLSDDDYLEILEPYCRSGDVELIDWPIETHSQAEYLELLQLPVYRDALSRARLEAAWVAFLDLDEFLFAPGCYDLPYFLKSYEQYGGVAVNWQIFGTSWLDELPPGGLITENLLLKADRDHFNNQWVKMVVQPAYVKAIDHPHYFEFIDGYGAVSPSGRPLPPGNEGQPVDIDLMRINHYWCGTASFLTHVKIPRRQKWGFSFPEALIAAIVTTYNTVEDRAILPFVPKLKERMR